MKGGQLERGQGRGLPERNSKRGLERVFGRRPNISANDELAESSRPLLLSFFCCPPCIPTRSRPTNPAEGGVRAVGWSILVYSKRITSGGVSYLAELLRFQYERTAGGGQPLGVVSSVGVRQPLVEEEQINPAGFVCDDATSGGGCPSGFSNVAVTSYGQALDHAPSGFFRQAVEG